MSTDSGRPVNVDVDIEADRTIVTVVGEKEAAVVVHSDAGERIFLPPEKPGEDGGDEDPYSPAGGESPYNPDHSGESPYGPTRQSDPRLGVNPTADGFLVRHDESITDFRLLR